MIHISPESFIDIILTHFQVFSSTTPGLFGTFQKISQKFHTLAPHLGDIPLRDFLLCSLKPS